MKALPIFALLTIVLIGCQTYQEGVPSDVSYVPIDQVPAEEDGAMTDITGDVVMEDDAMAEEAMVDDTMEEDVMAEEVMEDDTMAEEGEVMEPVAEPVTGQEIVIIVEETELVSLQPVAQDPDADQLTFTYSTPLDTRGQWQTTYGDAGEYTISITASDGELTSSRDALLIVNKREEPPTIGLQEPQGVEQAIDEDTDIQFRVRASDLNGDPISYEWKLDGTVVSVSDGFTYVADFDSSGSHTVKLDVSDGNSVVSIIWSVTVRNVNRAPVLDPIGDITIRETETVVLVPFASDPDGDEEVSYAISEPVGDSGVWQTTYNDAGVYTVRVTATDGEDADAQDVTVTVINVNRPPVITDIVQAR